METLTPSQLKYLRGLAHGLKPVVLVGRHGLTEAVVQSAEAALSAHELIKVRFAEIKDKALKRAAAGRLEAVAGCRLVGLIGHVGIFYRRHPDPQKRKIRLPA